MHPLTKTAEVLAELAAGGRIITGDRPGLLMLVDRAGNGVPAWQTALRAAANKLGQAVQFKIRMPGLLKQQLEEAAGNARRSVSAEIIHRLENSLADAVPTTSVIECLGLPPVALAPARAGRTYIAGPMTGLPDFNHPAFNAAAAALRAKGRTVINPADHGLVADAAWADYVRADLALLAGCETIYLLPGWSRSRGAMLEHHVARFLGMSVEFADWAEVGAEGQMQADHARLQAEAITILRIPAQPGMDPITVYIDSPEAGAAAVTIRCYSSAWAACAWTAFWGSMGSDAVKFMASVNADYMEGCMLWPNASAVPKREREYARRVAQAVIDHCSELVAKAVQP